MSALLSRAEVIRSAAEWLAAQSPKPNPLVPALRTRFDLSPKEAVDAIRECNLMHGRAM